MRFWQSGSSLLLLSVKIPGCLFSHLHFCCLHFIFLQTLCVQKCIFDSMIPIISHFVKSFTLFLVEDFGHFLFFCVVRLPIVYFSPHLGKTKSRGAHQENEPASSLLSRFNPHHNLLFYPVIGRKEMNSSRVHCAKVSICQSEEGYGSAPQPAVLLPCCFLSPESRRSKKDRPPSPLFITRYKRQYKWRMFLLPPRQASLRFISL